MIKVIMISAGSKLIDTRTGSQLAALKNELVNAGG